MILLYSALVELTSLRSFLEERPRKLESYKWCFCVNYSSMLKVQLKIIWNVWNYRQLTHKLTSSIGIEARLEQISGGDYLIHLEEANTQIEIDQKSGETHVMTVDDSRKKTPDSVRSKIKDILISCLEKYWFFMNCFTGYPEIQSMVLTLQISSLVLHLLCFSFM